MKLISIAGDIRLDPDKTESAFMARQLVQATLPHKNPGNVPVWSRTNGQLTVAIQPGADTKKKKIIGYPYGTIPRLLLFWITTEAIRTKNPRIELGNSLAQFMEELGLNPTNGRGKRSDAKRLQDQMRRLFQSTISFTQHTKGETWLNMQVAPKGALWWDDKQPQQGTLWKNWIQLGEDFFKAITSAPVPADMRVLKALKRSPLALDLYAWATYTAYQTQQTGQSRSLSWELLHEQFGAEYSDTRDFSKKSWNALLKIQIVYPGLNIERVRGGINVLPSKPSIIIKPKKKTKKSSNL
ncbi:MAG: plasmid encoded RepA protein [Alphaproteobacteria bacterium]|nr:plasmid encoded RepA protein [Alphaproteobacteria bacterium]